MTNNKEYQNFIHNFRRQQDTEIEKNDNKLKQKLLKWHNKLSNNCQASQAVAVNTAENSDSVNYKYLSN